MSLFVTDGITERFFFKNCLLKDNMQNLLFSRYIDNFIPLMG